MNMRSIRFLIWRNLSAHRLRAALTTLAIALGVSMVLAASIIGDAANRQATAVSETALPIDLEISRRDGAPFDYSLLHGLVGEGTIDRLVPSLSVQATLQPQDSSLLLKGVLPDDYADIYQPELAGGRFLPQSDSIVLPLASSLQHGLTTGDTVMLEAGQQRVQLTVSGRLAPAVGPVVADPVAFIPLATAQTLAAAPDQVDQAAIVLAARAHLDTTIASLKQQLGGDFIVARTAVPGSTNFNLIIIQAGMGIIGLIILFAAAFVILNAFAMAVTARTTEIGALRALGMQRRQVLWQVLAEAGLLGLAGSIIGLLLGLGLAFFVLRGQGLLTGAEFHVPVWGVMLAPLLGIGVTLGAAYWPSRRASYVSPLVAVLGRAIGGQASGAARSGRFGLVLLLLTLTGTTIFALGFQPHIFMASAVFGLVVLLLLLCLVLLLPRLVTAASAAIRPVVLQLWGTYGRLALDNLNRNPTRTAFTSSALTAGLLTIIATAGFLQVFLKGGFSAPMSQIQGDGWIIADITGDNGGRLDFENLNFDLFFEPINTDLAGELERLAQSEEIMLLPARGIEVPPELQLTPGSPALLVDPLSYFRSGNFKLYEGNEAQALDWLQQGNAILLQPYLAERVDAGVGDTINIPTLKGDVDFMVAGIGGSSYPMAILPLKAGELYFDAAEPSMIGFQLTQNKASVMSDIEAIVNRYSGYRIYRISEMNSLVIDAMEQMQRTMTALLSLAVIVAALGVVNTMVMNIAERWREIGLLRAVGATQRQIQGMVVVEASTLGFTAAAIAALFSFLLLGLLALLFLPNGYESMGQPVNDVLWREAYGPALRDMGVASLSSLVLAPALAALAAYIPAKRASTVNVVEATRGERLSLSQAQVDRPRRLPARHRRRLPRSLSLSLALRSLDLHRIRTAFSALAVSLGVAMTITADYVSSALLATLQKSGQGSMQITHGFIVEQFDITMGLVSYVLMAAAAFMVFNAFAMSIAERQQQIGALRSLGMTRRQVRRLVIAEGLLVGGLGTLAGILVGPFLGQSIIAIMQRYGGEFLAFGAGRVSTGAIFFAVIIGLGVTLASVLIPARRATRILPLEALRPGAASDGRTAGEQPLRSRRSLAAMLLILILFTYLAMAPPGAWITSPWSEALAILLVLVWLLSLGMLLPILIRLCGSTARRWFGRRSAGGRLIGDNVQRSQGRVILTVLTLAVGLGTITGLTGFMTYAFDDLMGASIRRIAEQDTWAVFPFDLESGIAGLTALDNIELPPAAVAALTEVAADRAAVVPVRFTVIPELSFFGDAYFTYVADPETIRAAPSFFRFTEGDWATAMPIMQSGCGALIAPLIASRQGVKVGDMLTISGQNGPLPCTIAGIGAGYVNASIVGEIVADELGATQPIGLSITPQPGIDLSLLETNLRATVEAQPGVYLTRMTDFAQTQDAALSLFVIALNGMLLLAVVAAALGVINTTVMSIHERRPELGLLRAVGATRRQIRQVVMGENALIGLAGAIFGVVAGMGSVVIIVTTLGGSAWGVTDLALWPAAGRALRPTLGNGILGILMAPLISAWVARWPLRSLLRGTTVDTLNPERQVEPIEPPRRRDPARSLYGLAWRNLQEHRLRTVFSSLAVALGAAMIVAAKVTSSGIIDTTEGENAFAVFIDIMGTMLSIVGMAIMAAAGFLIFNAFAMTIAQRRQQIGVMRSLGMTKKQVVRQLLLEAALTGVMGTALGLLLGPLFGNGVLAIFRQLGTEVGRGSATPGSLLLATTMGLGITLLSVWIPARQATSISPLAALRQERQPSHSGFSAKRIGFLGLAILLFLWGYLAAAPPGAWTGLNPPWEYMMALLLIVPWLLALTLLLPASIGGAGRFVGGLAKRISRANLRLIADNLARERRRVMLTTLTFAVGLGMISADSGFLSFSNDVLLARATEKTLSQTAWSIFPYDRSSGVAQISEMNSDRGIPEAVYDDVYQVAEGRAHVSDGYMVSVPEISSPMPGFPSFINGNLDSLTTGPGQFRFVEGSWETALPIMISGCGLLLPPAVAARHGAGLGDSLALESRTGPVACTIAGIGSGGSVPASIISSAAKERFVAGDPSYLTVWPQAGADVTALEADLRALADRHGENAFVSTPEDEYHAVTDTSDQLEKMSYAMLALAVIAAALGMVNTTVVSVTERRHELGLLRSVGMTRRQATGIVVGEAALIGLLGGLLGLIAGTGITIIFGLSYGGIPFGLIDLPLWEAALEAAPAAIMSGLVGVLLAPLVAAFAAYWPARQVLRGSAIETLDTHYRPEFRRQMAGIFSRGSIRTRFVIGTAVLMLLVLWGLTATITGHARHYLETTTADTLASLVELNASMVELNLPPDAENLTLDTMQGGGLDAEMMLQFRALVDELDAYGLAEFAVTDRDDIVLFSFDLEQIGQLLQPVSEPEQTYTGFLKSANGQKQIAATAPVRNEGGFLLGHVRLRMELGEISRFLQELNQAIFGAGLLITLLGLVVSWTLTTSLAQSTHRLSKQADQIRRGEFRPLSLPQRRFRLNVSLRTRLTVALVLILALLVGGLQLVVLPIERRKVEQVSQDTLAAGAEWMAQLISSSLADQDANLSQFGDMRELLQLMQRMDIGRLQSVGDQMRNESIAYTAVINEDGVIQLSDQFGLMGRETVLPARTVVEATSWQDEPIWQVTTPLRGEQGGMVSGGLQIGVFQSVMEEFLAESRLLFQLAGIIAILAGAFLAQAVGSAIAAPVRQLAADARRVGQGDLSVQFPVHGGNELDLLASAFNEMVAGLREREWLRDMFGRFVSHEVAEAIRSGQVHLEGENRVVSVLFCDIRDFTGRSERSTPEAVVALLNEYLPLVVEAAAHYEGTVNKFGGDSTLIIYGAPRSLPESAYQAVGTALEIRASLTWLNETLAQRGEPPVQIGVGINTGTVLAGAVGPPERQEYTVIGDTVNLASRIEALNKRYPQHDILISHQTYLALADRRQELELVDLGPISIRGKSDPVQVWSVIGRK